MTPVVASLVNSSGVREHTTIFLFAQTRRTTGGLVQALCQYQVILPVSSEEVPVIVLQTLLGRVLSTMSAVTDLETRWKDVMMEIQCQEMDAPASALSRLVHCVSCHQMGIKCMLTIALIRLFTNGLAWVMFASQNVSQACIYTLCFPLPAKLVCLESILLQGPSHAQNVFSEGNSSTCTLCPPGTYSLTTGMTRMLACTLCEPGKFTMAEGTTSCWECARFNMTVPVNAHFTSECKWSCDDGFEENYLKLSEEEHGIPEANSTEQFSTVDSVFRLPVAD